MAELHVEGDELVLHLTGVEKAEAIHGDLRVPRSRVHQLEVIDDAVEMTRVRTGFKVGMRVPGVASVAVVRGGGRKMFVAIHNDTPRAVRVLLDDESYDEWIVGTPEPEAVIASLKAGLLDPEV